MSTVENIINALANNGDLESAIKHHIENISHRFINRPNVDYCTESAMAFTREWRNKTMNPVICGDYRNYQEISFDNWFIERETFLNIFEKTELCKYYLCSTRENHADLIAKINKRIVGAIMEASTGICDEGGVGGSFAVNFDSKSYYNCGCTVGMLRRSLSVTEFISRHAEKEAEMMLFFCKKIHPEIYDQLISND